MTRDHCELLCLDVDRAESLRQRRLAPRDAELLAARTRALGDPLRLNLAVALRDGGELCVCDLGWIAERSDQLVSHHLRVLRTSGLVTSRRDGKMAMYRLTDAGTAMLSMVFAEATSRASGR